MSCWSYRSYENPALIELLRSLHQRDRDATAELVAVVAEVDRRQLYRDQGFDSMYAYCVGHLGMSDDVAYMRIRVGRIARHVPVILDMLADGRLRLSGVIRLVPHLTRRNADELLTAASGLTNKQLRLLVAERFPRADVPTVIRPLAVVSAAAASNACAPNTHTLPIELASLDSSAEPAKETTSKLGSNPVVPSDPPIPAQSMEPLSERARVEPLSKGRFALQMTVDQEFHDLLRYARALLSHAVPSGEELEVLKRALRAVIEQQERRKFGVGARLSSVKDPRDKRHISPAERCRVFVREEGSCAFVGEDSRRCGSQTRLHFHHRTPFAKGGDPTADNLTLYCGPHDQLQAERDYGEDFMRGKREAARARRKARALEQSAQPHGDAATAAAVRSARARGLSPADVLGSRAAAAEARARLEALLQHQTAAVADRRNQ